MNAETPRRFLLMKGGLYYRPNRAGYTGVRAQAGRYLESDAHPDAGVTAVHEDKAPEFSPSCWHEIKVEHLLARIATLEAAVPLPRSFVELDADRPPLPPETCPKVDRCSTLADAISADVGVIREGLGRSRSSIAREAGAELLDVEANLAGVRLSLEDLRADNAQLRAAAFYWRNAARALSAAVDGTVESPPKSGAACHQ